MKESLAWLTQAASDYDAAKRVLVRTEPGTYCQAIAKYQQSVEKNVKAMVSAMVELKSIASQPKDSGHTLYKSFKVLQLRMRSSEAMRIGLMPLLAAVLNEHFIAEANNLCQLAPSYPEPGQPFVKNSEYPFNTKDGTWAAPCSPEVFSIADIDRYHRTAQHFIVAVPRLIKSASLIMSKRN